MNDPEFLGDTTALLRPDENYDPEIGFLLIKKEIIDNMFSPGYVPVCKRAYLNTLIFSRS